MSAQTTVMTHVREACPGRQAHVASADDSDLGHGVERLPLSPAFTGRNTPAYSMSIESNVRVSSSITMSLQLASSGVIR